CDLLREDAFADAASDITGGRGQGLPAGMVVGDPGPDNVLEVVLPDEFPIGPGGRREPVRHANPFRDQGADQLAKRGILATDISNVARAKNTEPAGERLVTRHDPSLSRTRHPEDWRG